MDRDRDGAGRASRICGEGFTAGQPVMETLRARSRDLHDALDRGIRHGARMQRGEASVRRADGSLFPVGVSTTTFYRPGGGPPSVTAIFTDISDLKRLQEFRLRAERLEAVAALSASLAHEIRNPLMAIRSAVEQLASHVDEEGDNRVLADLVDASDRSATPKALSPPHRSPTRAKPLVRVDGWE